MAIRDAWAPNYKVSTLPPVEFDALVERCYTTFHGLASDIDDRASIQQVARVGVSNMRRVSASQLDALYSTFDADPAKQADAFWSACRAYILWCCYSVPEWLQGDLVQDITIAAITGLEDHKPAVSFSKWLNGIIFNMRAERYRTHKYQNPETPFSQLATEQEDGTFEEFQPSSLMEAADDESDLALPEERETSATAKLDELRVSFKKQADRDLFDLLRTGRSLEEAAKELGQSYSAVQSRFVRWKNKVDLKVPACLQFPYVTTRSWYNPLPLLSGRPAA